MSDIFGVTPSLLSFTKALKSTGHNIYIADPYLGEQLNFSCEADAYEYFVETVGIETYADLLHAFIDAKTARNQHQKNYFICFSVGAAALWKISSNLSLYRVERAFYFYGSQIRHFSHIEPSIPSTVIFPAQESHFSVTDLQQQVEAYALVSTKRCSYLHGFMNTHSVNFNEYAYTYYTRWLCNKISK